MDSPQLPKSVQNAMGSYVWATIWIIEIANLYGYVSKPRESIFSDIIVILILATCQKFPIVWSRDVMKLLNRKLQIFACYHLVHKRTGRKNLAGLTDTKLIVCQLFCPTKGKNLPWWDWFLKISPRLGATATATRPPASYAYDLMDLQNRVFLVLVILTFLNQFRIYRAFNICQSFRYLLSCIVS